MTRYICLFLALLLQTAASTAAEWSRFRGPNGSGLSELATVPVQWDKKSINWKVTLPGTGNSSPIVWNDHLYVTAASTDNGQRKLLCLNAATGKTIWQRAVSFKSYKKHKNNTFASNTPCADRQQVYVLWQSKQGSPLIAYNHQGDEAWRYDLGAYNHGQGGGTSPIVHDGLVIVANDHAKGSFLVAVDSVTGKEKWKIPRKGRRACYATPCVFQSTDRGAEIIFSHCFEGITGVDPASGKQNWMLHVFGDFPQRAVGSPFVAGDLIIANSGARVADKNLVAVRAPRSQDKAVAEEVYRLTRGAPHVPTAIAYKDLLFSWSDQGIVTCLNLGDGSQIWQKRVGGSYHGSPVCIAGKLYCVDRDGTVVVVAASKKFEVLARNPLGETSMATPAVGHSAMYVRTSGHLFSIGGSEDPAE